VQPESLDTGRSSSAEIMSSLWLPVRSSSAAADSDDRISSDSINARKMAVATREGRCLLRIIPARLRLSAQHVRSAGPSKGGRGNPNLSDRLGRYQLWVFVSVDFSVDHSLVVYLSAG